MLKIRKNTKRTKLPRKVGIRFPVIHRHWLSLTPLFDDRQFESFFRITRGHFEVLMQELPKHYKNFEKEVCIGFINSQVRLMAALKHLAYGSFYNSDSPYFEMSENAIRVGTEIFCKSILASSLKDKYLRPMTREGARKVELLHWKKFEARGCIGGLDCMHWHWDKFPAA